MKTAITNGAISWNGGEFYGPPDHNSLHLLNKYFTKYPEDADKIIINIKGGVRNHQVDCSPEGVRENVENCLKILDGKKSLDIFECARVDPNIPVETSIGALAELMKEGKISGIALSEVKSETIRRAAAVHPIAAVEAEVSLCATDVLTNGVAATCAELGIPIIAYSPMGQGMLTGEITKFEDLAEGDLRRHFPRFQPGVFEKNLELVRELKKLAKEKGCTPAQLALAWVKSLSGKDGNPVIVPIPGAVSAARVKENCEDIKLSARDEKEIDEILASFKGGGSEIWWPCSKVYGGLKWSSSWAIASLSFIGKEEL
jgi:pyridoxine 4-dehydrogenase